MKKLLLLVPAISLAVALAPAGAGTIVNTFAALPGRAADCQWFDDNLNDRSIGALSRQTDMLYNVASLPAGQNVTISQTATTQRGKQEVSFGLGGRTLCTSDEAFTVITPEPSPTAPEPSPTASP